MAITTATTATEGITTQGGLLYRNGEYLNIFDADDTANQYGFAYAEQLVAALERGETPELVIKGNAK